MLTRETKEEFLRLLETKSFKAACKELTLKRKEIRIARMQDGKFDVKLRRLGHPLKYHKHFALTSDRIRMYLDLLCKGHTYAAAAEATCVSDSSIRNRMSSDAKFSREVARAYALGTQFLEQQATLRGCNGIEEPVIHNGNLCYARDPDGNLLVDPTTGQAIVLKQKKYSDRLLMFVLQARDKERFANRQEVTGGKGEPFGSVQIDVDKLTPEQMRAIKAAIVVEDAASSEAENE